MKTVHIDYFSDILCIWAHIAELRVAEAKANHGDQVVFHPKFCSVFASTHRKISTTWHGKREYEGFNAHLRHVAESFPELTLNPDVWLTVRPASSNSAHLFLAAVRLVEGEGGYPPGATDEMVRAFRRAFFEQARDISHADVHREIAEELQFALAPIEARLRDGRAFAELASDYQDADAAKVQGSPTFVLNEGRQKLFGNVGYRILEANIQELLREPHPGQASWC